MEDFNPKRQIALVWSIEDVQSLASVSDNEAMSILEQVKHKHDASIGVSWDTISITAELMGFEVL